VGALTAEQLRKWLAAMALIPAQNRPKAGKPIFPRNVGGAVIPTLVSIYLLVKRELWVKGLVATAIVALV